ncbi:hypothetical protein [Cryobacterium sp. PH31-L1]|uniref:hypothetical protein n=1 Tax=Cryobacterium sp. PH31-L1 TaxID=3046199 RepID=UPI0024B93E38|nr:hypothetical protein [Cryobacterium sp. PH31-L1]MDJ0376258.1 hypothetical protein [Cryobacterium sp. PH31-L1]
MSSLIQQRMAIERIRTSAIAWTLFGGVGALLAIAQLVVGTEPTRAFVYFGVAGGMITVGLVKSGRYRRAIAAFTAENGVEAGKR